MVASGGAIRAGRAFVEIFADDSKLVRGLRRAQARLRSFGASVGNMGRNLVKFSAAAAAPVALSLKIFTSFNDKMLQVKAITGATAEEFELMNEKAKLLGRTTSFTASQVAAAQVEFARAGFKPKEIDQAITSLLDLARATDTELPDAVKIAGRTLRGFGLETDQMGRVVDVLATTANNASTTLVELGEGMKFVAPIASEAGESLEDTAAAMGVLADNALAGTVGGTQLARAYKNLAKPENQKKLEKLGISIGDQEGNFRKIADIIREIGQGFAGDDGNIKKLAAFEVLFGRAQAGALKLASSDAKFKSLTKAIANSEGAAAKAAKVMDSGLGGAFRRLVSGAEGIAIAVGESLADAFAGVFDAITKFLGVVTEWINKNKQIIRNVAIVITLIGALGVTLIAAGLAMKIMAFALTPLLAAFALLKLAIAGVIALLGLISSPIAAVIVVAGAAALAFTNLGKTVKTATEGMVKNFLNLKANAARSFSAIANALAAGQIDKAMAVLWASLKLLWVTGLNFLKSKWNGTLTGFFTFWAETVSGIQAVWELVTNAIAIGWTTMIGGLERAWQNFKSGFETGFEKFKKGTAQGFVILQGKLTGRDASDIQKDLNKIDKVSDSRLNKIENQRKQRISASIESQKSALKGLADEHRANMVAISEGLQVKLKALDAEQEQSTNDLAAGLKKATDEWQGAVVAAEEAAKATKEAVKKGEGGSTGSEGENLTARQRRNIQGIPEGPSAGAFQAAAAFRLSSQAGKNRNQVANENTAENTRRMVGELKKITLPFPIGR
jgi:TP901 family phage tail tape measure protein